MANPNVAEGKPTPQPDEAERTRKNAGLAVAIANEYAAEQQKKIAALADRLEAADRKLALRTVTRCQKCGVEALPSPTHALDLEYERDEARIELAEATTRLAQLEKSLADFRAWSQGIEALPRFAPTIGYDIELEMVEDEEGFWISRSAVLAGRPPLSGEDR